MEIQRLIREMSLANRLWGAPRIHGELLKLGIEVAQSTVAKYMARRGRGPSQTWKTFLRNHTAGVAATDFLSAADISQQSRTGCRTERLNMQDQQRLRSYARLTPTRVCLMKPEALGH
jgi:hypothetical protein